MLGFSWFGWRRSRNFIAVVEDLLISLLSRWMRSQISHSHGNPAAVCIPDVQKDDRWMMNVAAEMNLSETAFLSAQP